MIPHVWYPSSKRARGERRNRECRAAESQNIASSSSYLTDQFGRRLNVFLESRAFRISERSLPVFQLRRAQLKYISTRATYHFTIYQLIRFCCIFPRVSILDRGSSTCRRDQSFVDPYLRLRTSMKKKSRKRKKRRERSKRKRIELAQFSRNRLYFLRAIGYPFPSFHKIIDSTETRVP